MIHANIESAIAPTLSAVCVERAPLFAALELFAKRIIQRRNTIPILSCVALGIGDAGGLHLYGTNLDLSAAVDVPGSWEGAPFAVAVDAVAFRDAVKKLEKGAHVQLEADAEAGKLRIVAGRSRFSLTLQSVDDLPCTPAEPGGDAARFQLDAETLADDIKALTPAVGTEESRYYLCGMAVQAHDGELALVSTNGNALAIVRHPLPDGAGNLADAIVPSLALKPVAHVLKGLQGPVDVEIDSKLASFGFGAVRIVAKLVDGDFPRWFEICDKADAEERQSVAMPELEPRMDAGTLGALTKALGAPLSLDTAGPFGVLSSAERPEFAAYVVLGDADAAPKGYAYEISDAEQDKAERYLCGLAQSHGFSVLSERRLRIVDGRAVGITFGASTWEPHAYEDRPNYETFTMERVHVSGGQVFEDGAYSLVMPAPRDCPIVAPVSLIGDDGDTPLRQNSAGAIELSEAAVRSIAGPVDVSTHVEIAPRFFHRGEVLNGFTAAAPLSMVDGKRSRRMTDSEVTRAYDADPAGTIARLQPVPTAEGNMAAEAIADFARALVDNRAVDVHNEGAELVDNIGDAPTESPELVAIEEQAPETAAQPAIDAPAPATPAETVAEALSAPGIDDTVAMEAAGDAIGAMFAELSARIAALEAAAPLPAVQTVDEGANARIAELEAELAELRGDLAMAEGRADRERDKRRAAVLRSGQWREKYLRKQTTAIGWESRVVRAEQRAEDAEFTLADMAPRLAAAELAAKEAAAVYEPQLDAKQAEIVQLRSELRDWLIFGKVQKREPVRVVALPSPCAFPVAANG